MTGKVTAKLGKTSFEIEDQPTPNVLKITRVNSDGVTEFFIPRELVVDYVLRRAEAGLVFAIRTTVRKWLT